MSVAPGFWASVNCRTFDENLCQSRYRYIYRLSHISEQLFSHANNYLCTSGLRYAVTFRFRRASGRVSERIRSRESDSMLLLPLGFSNTAKENSILIAHCREQQWNHQNQRSQWYQRIRTASHSILVVPLPSCRCLSNIDTSWLFGTGIALLLCWSHVRSTM